VGTTGVARGVLMGGRIGHSQSKNSIGQTAGTSCDRINKDGSNDSCTMKSHHSWSLRRQPDWTWLPRLRESSIFNSDLPQSAVLHRLGHRCERHLGLYRVNIDLATIVISTCQTTRIIVSDELRRAAARF